MRKISVIALAMGYAALIACSLMPLEMDLIEPLRPGMTQTQVLEITGRSPTERFSLELGGRMYQVDTYSMQTGNRTEITFSCGQWGCMPIPYTVPEVAPFALVYGDDGLVAWDFIEALNKSDDQQMATIGRRVSVALETKR